MTQRTPPLSEADSDLLSAYIDQQLSTNERAALEQRLEQEPELRLALDELRATVEALRALPPVAPPRSFTLPATVRAPTPWLSLGMLRFGSAFASVLLVLTFLPALLRFGGTMAPVSAPAASYEAAMSPTTPPAASTTAPEMMPQAASTQAAAAEPSMMAASEPTTPPTSDPAAIVAAQPTPAAEEAPDTADTPADGSQARLLAETANAVPLAGQGPETMPAQPPADSASDTGSAAGGSVVSPPIATSGSSSPGTTVLEQPVAAPEPTPPAEPPISALNLLRLALAVTAVGFAVAFWRRRQQEQW